MRSRRLGGIAGALVAASLVTAGCAAPHATTNVTSDAIVLVDGTTCDGDHITGSGFVLDDGTVITNRHVVADTRRLTVDPPAHAAITVRNTRRADGVDVAVIHPDRRPAGGLHLVEHDPVPGDWVRAVGYPGGDRTASGEGRIVDYVPGAEFGEPGRILRARTDIEPGSSGSPLLTESGEVAGLVFAIERATGYALAIPPSEVRAALHALSPTSAC
jgi:S1-C subfamily serine protease